MELSISDSILNSLSYVLTLHSFCSYHHPWNTWVCSHFTDEDTDEGCEGWHQLLGVAQLNLQSGHSSQLGLELLSYHHLSCLESKLELPHILWRQGHVSTLHGSIHSILGPLQPWSDPAPRAVLWDWESQFLALLSRLPHTWCQEVFLTHDKGIFNI